MLHIMQGIDVKITMPVTVQYAVQYACTQLRTPAGSCGLAAAAHHAS